MKSQQDARDVLKDLKNTAKLLRKGKMPKCLELPMIAILADQCQMMPDPNIKQNLDNNDNSNQNMQI